MQTTRNSDRFRELVLLGVVAAVVLAVGFFVLTSRRAEAEVGVSIPARIMYDLDYQATPDRSLPLTHAKAVWIVRSFSDWDFEFLSGADAGTTYSLRPSGVFTSTDGHAETSTQHPPGTTMVPLPDMAVDARVTAALTGSDLPGVRHLRRGEEALSAVARAAEQTRLPANGLRGLVIERDSTSDAFEFDLALGDWVPSTGDMVETIVVDADSSIVVFREEVFDGSLLRRVAVSSVESLD